MQTFKDNSGRKWTIDLAPETIKRVAAAVGCGDDISAELLTQIGAEMAAGNSLKFLTLLWRICEPQAMQRRIPQRAFIEIISGCGDRPATAFQAEIDFLFANAAKTIQQKVS